MGLIKNKRALVKASVTFFSLIVISAIVVFASGVFGLTHDAIVTITPSITTCGNAPNSFIVNIENDASVVGADNIFEVRIYASATGIIDGTFSCGLAPEGWIFEEYNPTYKYCQYDASIPEYMIGPGESKDFTFNAHMQTADNCLSSFKVSTLDDDASEGEHEYNYPEVFIDCVNPTIIKTVNEPKRAGDGFDWWITQDTIINIEAHDVGGCNRGLDYCQYRYKIDSGDFGKWTVYNEDNEEGILFNIKFNEDSVHDIEIECYDNAGNKQRITETDKVDSTAPTTTKTFNGPQKIDENDVEWIDGITTVELTAKDGGDICAIGLNETFYKLFELVDYNYCWNSCVGWQTSSPESEGWLKYTGPLTNIPESCHVLEYYSTDKLGNIENVNTNCFFVDKTAPIGNKTVGEPKIPLVEDFGVVPVQKNWWVGGNTQINLDCTDPEPHPSGDEEVCYKIGYDLEPFDLTEKYCTKFGGAIDNGYCCYDVSGENSYPFTFEEDSFHSLEYFCRDAVDKTSEIDKEIFKVDSQKPIIEKDMFGSYLRDCPSGTDLEHGDCYVADNGENGVDITVYDDTTYPECAVDNVQCKYEIWWETTSEMCASEVGPEHLYNFETNQCFVDGNSFETNQRIIFTEDSTHHLIIHCEDALGNYVDDEETFLVDSTAPTTTKTYGEPHYPEIIIDEQYPHWISTDTPITLAATDVKVGLDKTYVSVKILDDNKYCESYDSGECVNAPGAKEDEFTVYEKPFTIGETSCHLIEFYSVDKLGNTEDVKRQCVFVNENSVPVPNKIIDEPVTEWYPTDVALNPLDPDATQFYGSDNEEINIVPLCWNGEGDQIDCWKVTKDTKISLSCSYDEAPQHPTGNEKVCFNVELDAEDATQSYCRQYGGSINEENGFCCVDTTIIENFYFKEESEHNLKFYCTNGFGTPSVFDEEKFKVTGNMFKIRINDKWNLISVPFKLLNDNPAEVFNKTESVKTVWGYNSETKKWSVYRPENALTNSLETIEPGLGYWVLADCENFNQFTIEDLRVGCGPDGDKCESLVVGGSLLNPGPVTPPSQEIVKGWNLIGYYGTDGRYRYNGPDSPYIFPSKNAYCALYSLRNLDGGFNWNALYGYWEPYNTDWNPFTSVWQQYDECDNLDPGAGYWLASDVEDTYNPTTTCDNNMCQDN